MHEHWENAKKRKAQVNKIALRKCDVRSQFFFFLAKVVRLFWKINETEEKEIRDFYNLL